MQAKGGKTGRYLFDNQSFPRELFPSGIEVVADGNSSKLPRINIRLDNSSGFYLNLVKNASK